MLSRDIGHGNSKQFDICEWFKKLQYFKDYSPRLQWLLIFGFLDGWSSSNLNLLPMQMLSSSLTTTFSFFCASELSTDTRFFLAGLSCSNLTFALKERLSSSSKSKPQSKPNKKGTKQLDQCKYLYTWLKKELWEIVFILQLLTQYNKLVLG